MYLGKDVLIDENISPAPQNVLPWRGAKDGPTFSLYHRHP